MTVGEDITNNVRTIKSIPLVLNQAVDFEIRGEIFLSKKIFNELNKQRLNQGLNYLRILEMLQRVLCVSLIVNWLPKRKLDAFLHVLDDTFKTHRKLRIC